MVKIMVINSEPVEPFSNVVDNLYVSTKKEQVESVFLKSNIVDKSKRIQLLRKCMNVLDISNTDSSICLDDEYDDELAIFLNGKWRMLA